MKRLKLVALLMVAAVPFVTGCGASGESASVVGNSDIAAYVAAHPDSAAGTEVQGGDQ